jgi:hypothetical protein
MLDGKHRTTTESGSCFYRVVVATLELHPKTSSYFDKKI